VVRVTQQLRCFRPQLGNLGQRIAVVTRAALRAARAVGGKHLLAQVALVGKGHEAFIGSAVQAEDPGVRPAFCLGLGLGRTDQAGRQARQLCWVRDHQLEGVRFLEHVLGEQGVQFGDARVDLLHPRLGLCVQRRAGAGEIEVGQLDQAQGLFVQAQRRPLLVDRIDPREQLLVQVDRVEFTGQSRVDLDLQLLQELVRIRVRDVAEGIGHPLQCGSRQLQRFEGVGEIRRLGVVADGRDLDAQLLEAAVECGRVMLVADAVERRYAVGGVPWLKEGIVVGDGLGRLGGRRCGCLRRRRRGLVAGRLGAPGTSVQGRGEKGGQEDSEKHARGAVHRFSRLGFTTPTLPSPRPQRM
jgi:hypothetical protein